MTTITAQPEQATTSEPASERIQLRGLWARLAREAPPRSERAAPAGFWARLAREQQPLASPAELRAPERPRPAGLWGALSERSNISLYRPRAIPGIVAETIVEGDQTFTVLRSPTGNYVRLTPAERELWQAMDGSQSVAQLTTFSFIKFQQPFIVPGLVAGLREQGFLTDPPYHIYRKLRASRYERGLEGWSRKLLRFLQNHEFAISGIDQFYGALYQAIGRIFFTRVFGLLSLLLIVAGLAAFFLALAPGTDGVPRTYQLIDTSNILLSLLSFWGITLISFTVHESAHALAVKHYGRTVQRGGMALYYGMPAAFVDTSDMWLTGRQARIVVSLAGPYADLLLGSLAALSVYNFPASPYASLAFQLAFACYITTLFNANPLLELDGYYVLVDWLRLPGLRPKALSFVSGPFWRKLRDRAPLSGEEHIFTIYGLLTLIYTGVAVALAANFWRLQLRDLIVRLLEVGPLGIVVALIILALVVIPIAVGLLLAAWGMVRAGADWVGRSGLSRRPALVAGALLLLVLLLAALPLRFSGTLQPGILPAHSWAYLLITAFLWGVAQVALGAIRSDYRGARVGRALDGLVAANAFTLLTQAGRIAELALFPGAATAGATPLGWLWVALDTCAFLLLMIAGFVSLLDVDLLQAPPHELIVTAGLLVAAFACGGVALHWAMLAAPAEPFTTALLAAVPVYFGVMALALLLPHLSGFNDSRLLWSWLLVWVGILVQTSSYFLLIHPLTRTLDLTYSLTILAAGCWATAWSTHYVTLRTIAPEDRAWRAAPATGEAGRLQLAFQHSYAGCYLLLREVYGRRRAKLFDDRMDVLAATANWDVTLEREGARISPLVTALALHQQGQRYAEVLRYTVETIAAIAGSRFARRAIQIAYDALPWPERETADRLCFPNTPWARELSRSFGSARDARLRLLRQVDLFAALDDEELAKLAGALQPQRAPAGRELLAMGVRPPGLWIVEAGEVVAWQDRQIVDELHRGEFFGATAATLPEDAQEDEPAPAQFDFERLSERSYRTTVGSELLFLPLEELRRLLGSAAAHTADGIEIVERLHIFERVPLLADLPRARLRELARKALRHDLPARSLIVREGIFGHTFYVIKYGRAAVVARSQAANGSDERKARIVAQLGPGEFFGELELLRGKPPVASVVSIEPIVLLALPHAVLAELLTDSTSLARSLQQVGSGRMADLATS